MTGLPPCNARVLGLTPNCAILSSFVLLKIHRGQWVPDFTVHLSAIKHTMSLFNHVSSTNVRARGS